MKCMIDGCGRDADYKADQLCQRHYFRLRRNGHFEIIKVRRPFIQDDRGYRRVWDPEHPLASKYGYVFEHRKIVFAKYGWNLPDCEICGKPTDWETCHVDHIDENPSNNASENLRPLCAGCNTSRNRPASCTFSHCTSITFDGVTKTAHEWSKDPRVGLSGAQIRRRKQCGKSDYDALFGEKVTHNGKLPVKKPTPPPSTRKNSINATIDGVTKTSNEWARTAGCTVCDGTIRARIKAGWPHKEAVFSPQRAAIQATYPAKSRALEESTS